MNQLPHLVSGSLQIFLCDFAMNVIKKTVEKLHHMKIKFNWRKFYAYKQDLAPRASAAITPQT